MRQFCVAILFLFLFPVVLPAVDDPAKGHYESALFFMQNGKFQQAVDDLNFIAKSFPQSPLADDALLQLGIYYYEQKQMDQSLQYFQQIKDRYTNSNSAPAAYYYIGQISLTKRSAAALDEAYANFERVTRVFPSSNWVDKSLVGAGTALKWRGEFDKAYEEFAKLKVRFAESPLAPVSQLEMGICSLYGDHFLDAAVDFQQVVDRFPSSEQSKKALEFNTILYRLYIAPATDRKIYAPDPAFSGGLTELDDPSGMAVDSQQNVYLSDKGKKMVYVLDPKGRTSKTLSINAPHSISVDDQDRVLIANQSNVISPGNDPVSFSLIREGKAELLEEIRSVALNQFGDYFVVSNKAPGILPYDQNRILVSHLPFSKTEKEYYKVLTNARNQVYALDKQRKQLVVFAPDGRILFGLGPSGKGFDFDKIEDFALDRANHIYLLTKNPRGILIFSPAGSLMRYIASDKKGILDFEDAKLIAVGPSGAIYVLDKDARRILKLG